jgi:hypothetical protein
MKQAPVWYNVAGLALGIGSLVLIFLGYVFIACDTYR